MERGKFVESKITSDDSLSLANLQNIYFKNVGATDVRIGLFVLKPAQDRYIKTGNITLDAKSLDIKFFEGIGKAQDLYVSYIKMPDCICE